MRAIALTFNYDLVKMKTNGRFWADVVYGVDVLNIFKYSAASYATFLNTNPKIPLTIYTNDVDLIRACLSDYEVDLSKVDFIDYTRELVESKKSPYTFQPIVDLCYSLKDSTDYIIKIDNDLIWHGEIPNIDISKDVLVWKFERYVKDGDPRMGEILVCDKVCGDTNFKEFNIGILGYPINYPFREFYDVSNAMTLVDITPVSDLGVRIWHCCEQTAQSWIFHKHNYNIIELYPIVEHFYENKLECIEKAKHLIRR